MKKRTIAQELINRQRGSDDQFEAINNVFLDPKVFVWFIRTLAWDYESFVYWIAAVLQEACDTRNRFDT